MDSNLAVNLILTPTDDCHPLYSLICCCKELMNRAWSVRIIPQDPLFNETEIWRQYYNACFLCECRVQDDVQDKEEGLDSLYKVLVQSNKHHDSVFSGV